MTKGAFSGLRVWLRTLGRLAVILLISSSALFLRECSVVGSMDAIADDLLSKQVAKGEAPNPGIVIIAVDEESLHRADAEWGGWPWPREAFSRILEQCSEATVVGMSMLLPGEDRPVARLPVPDPDGHVPFISAAALTELPQADAGDDDLALRFSLFVHDSQNLELPQRSFVIPPRPRFTDRLDALGFINLFPDLGGTVRSYPMFIEHNGLPYPSFAVGVTSSTFGSTNRQAYVESPAGIDRWFFHGHTLHLRGLRTHVGDDGGFRLVYPKEPHTLIPAIEVLNSAQAGSAGSAATFDRAFFKDKVVLLGWTATGFQDDRRSTPLGDRVPSVLIHATAIDNLLSGKQFQEIPAAGLWILCLVLSTCPWIMNRARPKWVLLFSLTTLLGYMGLLVISAEHYWMIPATPPLFAWFISLVTHAGIRWDSEQEKAREMEVLDRAKQQFTDMLVHDLKGQIGNLRMSVDLLEELSSGEELHALIDSMSASGQRMLAQVNSLLDIRRMEEGRMPLRMQPIGLHALVDRCVQEYRASAQLVRMTLHYEPNPMLASAVEVDPDVMQRILANLLLNAIHYGNPESGIVVRLQLENKCAVVEVENEGRNLPETAQHSLFQPFHYFEQSNGNTKAVSTGLGLAFCKLALDAHGGEIEIRSPLPDGRSGVCARISLPLSPRSLPEE